MNKIIEVIKNKEDYIGANGCSDEEIAKAEKVLKLKFAKDYKDYLTFIGLACFDGHELTGITKNSRLNVVDVTNKQRANIEEIPNDWYIVEELNYDGIIIWQNTNGEIFETQHNQIAGKIHNSLLEYIDK